MCTGHATSYLAFVHQLPESPASLGQRHLVSAIMLLHLLHHSAAASMDSHAQASIPLHDQDRRHANLRSISLWLGSRTSSRIWTYVDSAHPNIER